MTNYLEDNEDLQYYLDKGIDWETLVRVTELDFKTEDGFTSVGEAVEFYREIATLVGEFSANEIAPKAREIDREGILFTKGEVRFPEPLEEIFKGLKGLELHGMCLPRELGGMNCPLILYYINSELIARADVSVMAHHGFHGGIATAMLMYSILEGSSEIQKDPPKILKSRFGEAMSEIARGEAWGSMDITESNAGSDMAALRCVGEQDEESNWHITGQKILITSGHGKYHFVIARSETGEAAGKKPGLEGLSLFLVPIYEDDGAGNRKWLATLDNLEEKLGHHGSATVSVSYDRTPAHLIGERGDGFKLMLLLMNSARIGVGFESIGLCEAAVRMARAYAAERPSMGKTIDHHEMIADYLDEMETDIQALRAMAVEASYHEEMAQKLRLKRFVVASGDLEEEAALERQIKRHQRRARMITPLLKYRAAEKAVEIARKSLQIHGGAGYTCDYGAEKLLRDAIVFPIYEGTSQIQALMAMKDNLGTLLQDPQRFLRKALAARGASLLPGNTYEKRIARVQARCSGAILHIVQKVMAQKLRNVQNMPISQWKKAFVAHWDPKHDFSVALLHAERLTEMLADKVACEVLLKQMKKHPERESVLAAYLERAEPRVEYMHALITGTGERLLDALASAELPDTSSSQPLGSGRIRKPQSVDEWKSSGPMRTHSRNAFSSR